ncbi:MarR family transcriptional regulator [Planotetraspora kaengkrachanensis]|uniref:Putative transcriptional regulator, MarR family protein n=1 Tax=Planotetraspora kaengkrachanensis TaxID=575193 RepID=A0A8J3M1Y9_9ACTN|nr:putative transcriptional regulator, MarR family protein [Planotetraspora kaengkrachanensis]
MGLVYRWYAKASTAVLEDVPGGTRGYHVISDAVHERAGSQIQLAQRHGVNKTVMTYLVDDLEGAGLVERRADPSDRRNRVIVVTERGRELWESVQSRLREVERHVLSDLTAEEQAVFCRLLGRVADRADSIDPVSDACAVGKEIAEIAEPRQAAG